MKIFIDVHQQKIVYSTHTRKKGSVLRSINHHFLKKGGNKTHCCVILHLFQGAQWSSRFSTINHTVSHSEHLFLQSYFFYNPVQMIVYNFQREIRASVSATAGFPFCFVRDAIKISTSSCVRSSPNGFYEFMNILCSLSYVLAFVQATRAALAPTQSQINYFCVTFLFKVLLKNLLLRIVNF